MESIKKKDILWVIFPLYYFSKVLGVTPFNLKGQIGARKFYISHSALIYSIVINIISLIGQVFVFLQNVDKLGYGRVQITSSVINGFFHLVFSISFFVMLIVKNVTVLSLFNMLLDIGEIMFDKMNMNQNGFSNWKRIIVCGIFIYFITFIPVFIYCNYARTYIFGHFVQNSVLYSFFPFYIIDVHVINIMYLLKQYFLIINSRILNVMKEFHTKEATQQCKKVDIKNTLPLAVNSIKIRLKCLKELHFYMCNIAEFTYSVYGIKILLSTADKFFVLLSNVYFIIVTILNYDRGVYDNILYTILPTNVAILGAVQLILILWSANSSSNEVS
ncbi:hypothetical protein L9F63_026358, partial [Diploptera punctata]